MKLEWKTCLRAGVTLLLLYLAIHYWGQLTGVLGIALSAAVPLFLGCIVAYVVNILMSFLERKLPGTDGSGKGAAVWRALKRPLAMLVSFAAIALAVVLIVNMILPELAACVRLLLQEVPEALKNILIWLQQHIDLTAYGIEEGKLPDISTINWQEIVTKFWNVIKSGFGDAVSVVANVFSTLFSGIVTAVVALVFSIYLLLGKEKIGKQLHRAIKVYLGETAEHKILYVLKTFDRSFHSFISGQCLEAVVLGFLCVIGMLILRLPYASMIGCLIGFTALIPVAGAYIGAAVGAFMIFTVSPFKALVFLIFLVILQQLEGNLIYPKVVGASIGLPGIWVLAAVTIGGGVMGVGGMLLGVPTAAAIYQLLKADLRKRSKPKEEPLLEVELEVELESSAEETPTETV